MRRKDRQIEDKEIIHDILSKSKICRVAINDEKFPYIVPLHYGYCDESLYFHSAPNGKKIDLIKRNNKVCFEIEYSSEIIEHEESCKWTTKYRSIIGNGEIEIIDDFQQKIKGLDLIMAHNGRNENIYNEKLINNIVILKLTILDLTAKQSGNW